MYDELVNGKVLEIGTVQQVTDRLFKQFMNEFELGSGDILISSKLLYSMFADYVVYNCYYVRPNHHNFGRAVVKVLKSKHKRDGAHYFIGKKIGAAK